MYYNGSSRLMKLGMVREMTKNMTVARMESWSSYGISRYKWAEGEELLVYSAPPNKLPSPAMASLQRNANFREPD